VRTVHKVCNHLLKFEAVFYVDDKPEKCRECPAWEKVKYHGRCKRACRLGAEEFVNIVKTGNPWGKRGKKYP
jgi:hypothetical protein